MSEEVVEELKGEIRAALQGFSEPEIFLLIGIGVRVDSPSQAVRRVSPIVHLSPKEEEVTRKVAKLKKMVLAEDQGADFSKVLQNLRKPKESEMDKKFRFVSEDMIKKVISLEAGEMLLVKDWEGREIVTINLGGATPRHLNIDCPKDYYFVIARHELDQISLQQAELPDAETKKKDVKLETKIPQTESQVVVKEDPKKINDVRARRNFGEQLRPIVVEYGWHIDGVYGIVIDRGEKMMYQNFGYLYMNFELIPEGVVFSFIHRNEPGKTSEPLPEEERGLPEKRWELLPKIEEFGHEVTKATGLQVVIHK